MFGNIALDVFIGLSLVFLLYSLLATIFQEFISQIFDLRAKMLQKGIARMLRDDNKGKKDDPEEALWKRFYDNPGIRYLSESNSIIMKNRPSYIGSSSFSTALVQILRGNDHDGSIRTIDEIRRILAEAHAFNEGKLAVKPEVIIGPQTLRQLNNLMIDAQQDAGRFIALTEQWFDNTMSRVSGWYKRQTRWILLVMGIVIAISANVDAIRIYSILARDKTAREQMVNIALKSQQNYTAYVDQLKQRGDTSAGAVAAAGNVLLDSVYRDVQNDISLSGNVLGIGWNDIDTVRKMRALEAQLVRSDSLHAGKIRQAITDLDRKERVTFRAYRWSTPIGWLLTALAISLGAPFWFDLLNKLVKLRAAGGKPDEDKEKDKGKSDRKG
jgi:hypothetical protein